MKFFSALTFFFASAVMARVPSKRELQGEDVVFWDRLLRKGYDYNSVRYPTQTAPTPAYYPNPAPNPVNYPVKAPTPVKYPIKAPTPVTYPVKAPTPVKYPINAPNPPNYYPTAAPTPPLPVFNCSSTQTSGGASVVPQEYMVNLKKTQGTFDAFYEMYTNPDGLDILYEGANIFSTGGLVSGSRNFTVTYGSASSKSTSITLKITAPNFGTGWIVAVGCPN
jgi:hypothetical protein